MTIKLQIFLPADLVLTRFCTLTGTPLAELQGPAITRDISRLRHEAMWLMRRMSTASLAGIGKLVGGKDPKSVEHGLDRICRRLQSDRDYGQRLASLSEAIAAPAAEPAPDLHLVMATSILSDAQLSDGDARLAALTILRHGMNPGGSDFQKGI